MPSSVRSARSIHDRKVSVDLPAHLLAQVDAAAKARGQSRGSFIRRLLVEAVRARRDANARRRIDALFADPRIQRAQSRTARAFERVLAWDDERW